MSMESVALTRTNLSEQIADHLEQVIVSAKISMVSEKLPSEQALAQQYNVSRPVIREALKLLQERGLVTMKNGDGSYITKPESDTIMQAITRFTQMGQISNDDLTEVRQILEVSSAKKAAVNASDEELDEIAAIANSMRDQSLSLKARVELDIDFHNAIAKASGNQLLETFVEVMTTLLQEYMGKGVLLPGGVDDAVKRHLLVVKGLRSRNPRQAEEAMTEHLNASSRNVKVFDSRVQGNSRP